MIGLLTLAGILLIGLTLDTGDESTAPISGTEADDTVEGGHSDDEIIGRGDDDLLLGGPGDDLLSGNDGDDRLYGGAGDDTLLGDGGNDHIYGGDGNDLLDGTAASDEANQLFGEAGDDILFLGARDFGTGGEGSDAFVIEEASSATITDFNPEEDVLIFQFEVAENADASTLPEPEWIIETDPSEGGTTVVRVEGDSRSSLVYLPGVAALDSEAIEVVWLTSQPLAA